MIVRKVKIWLCPKLSRKIDNQAETPCAKHDQIQKAWAVEIVVDCFCWGGHQTVFIYLELSLLMFSIVPSLWI